MLNLKRILWSGPSLTQRLAETDDRPSGFDYMRFTLSCMVIVWHSSLICYGVDPTNWWVTTFAGPFFAFVVPMFFSLSGFLTAGSFERNKTLVSFMGLRAFRIVPALTVEVIISAFILGPLLTTLPLSDYFTHHDFLLYLLNVTGEIHYYLPGVFTNNPFTQVNGQLWTVPYELVCYLILCTFAVLKLYQRRGGLWYILLICTLLQVLNTIYRGRDELGGATGSTVIISFIAGILMYRYKEWFRFNRNLFWLALIVSIALVSITNGMRFAALPIAYFTVYLGLLNPPREKWILSGDYSYGIYLYGFPVQQALAAISPFFLIWYNNLIATLPIVFALSIFSWWVIERPAMMRRGVLKQLENWYLSRDVVRNHAFLRRLVNLQERPVK